MSASTSPEDYSYTGSNPYIDALVFGGAWTSSDPVVDISYAVLSGQDPFAVNGLSEGLNWSTYESLALAQAMQAWENVANISFSVATDPLNADVWYWLGDYSDVGGLGWHEVPSSDIVGPLYGVFAQDGTGWNTNGLQAGGYGFLTMLQQIGHGLGLDHPHPGAPGDSAFPGVTSALGSYGTHDLNQGVYTVMGLNDGWPTEYPYLSPERGYLNYGYSATPMALDIAAIQDIYGANMSYNDGDTTYTLPDTNGIGTGWASIWDAGGNDTLSAEGSTQDFWIDLRAATLEGENAGGYMSFSRGVTGGFTIANGVVIETALGGDGDDTLMGNDADNVLKGNDGADVLQGLDGADKITGGAGDDTLLGGDGQDVIWAGGGGADDVDGGDGNDMVRYDNSSGRAFVDLAIDQRGEAFLAFFERGTSTGTTYTAIENITGSAYSDDLRGDEKGNRINGGAGDDRLYGRLGDDVLIGGTGADFIYGGMGADRMVGGYSDGQSDVFVYFSAKETGLGSGARDYIAAFAAGEDRIDLSRVDSDINTDEIHDQFVFIGQAGFSGTAGELAFRIEGGNTIVHADIDGDSVADFEIELAGILSVTGADFLL